MERLKGSNLIFVAGGIGLVPLRSLINYVLFRRSRYKQITILYGVKSPEEILFAREIRQWEKLKEVKVMVTVDRRAENWKGRVGVVTTLFPEIEVDAKNTYVLVVGPPIMYKYVILALGNKEISSDRIILSLERRMKCGLGKCGHCQIGSFYVCQEGPVFSYSEIRHLEGVI